MNSRPMQATLPPIVEPFVSLEPPEGGFGKGGSVHVWDDVEEFQAMHEFAAPPWVIADSRGRVWSIEEAYEALPPPTKKYPKFLAVFFAKAMRRQVGFYVTPISMSLDEIKEEICCRLPVDLGNFINDEVIAGEGWKPAWGPEAPGEEALAAKLQAAVRAAPTAAGVMAVLMGAREWEHPIAVE